MLQVAALCRCPVLGVGVVPAVLESTGICDGCRNPALCSQRSQAVGLLLALVCCTFSLESSCTPKLCRSLQRRRLEPCRLAR